MERLEVQGVERLEGQRIERLKVWLEGWRNKEGWKVRRSEFEKVEGWKV